MNTSSPSQNGYFWNQPVQQLLANLHTSDQGLTTREVSHRRIDNGLNVITDVSRKPLWKQFLGRFRNPLIILLLFASTLSAITGDLVSFFLITMIVLLSVVLDFIQNVRAEKIVDALHHSVAIKVNVLRNGQWVSMLVKKLVPGDIVQLSPGNLVPADGRLLSSKDLYINQAILTGESFPVEKLSDDLSQSTEDLTKASNAVFMGTSVISGTAIMIIVNTGKKTRLGNLAGSLSLQPPRNDFEIGIQSFGLLILRIAIIMVLFVLVINILFHRPLLESFLFALALAVGLTPELLPMIMTITLARGAERMAKQHVIVKHLPSMHNLGAMNILCMDKTGTLTEAKIRLLKTYDFAGEESDRVLLLSHVNSFFESGIKSPLDLAILEYREIDVSAWKKIDEVPFDFERRRISVLVENAGKRYLIIKGAPEDVLKLSTHYENKNGTVSSLNNDDKQKCHKKFESLGDEGMRVLAVAIREVPISHNSAIVTDEMDLMFVGFLAFLDPPKESAAGAIKLLAEVGVNVKIITGDNERVTLHVCQMLNMGKISVLTGDDIAQLSDEALAVKAQKTDAFCRINPQQKSRIIHALRAAGKVVGFLGDGINDATALHVADVGISVNTAADVAKEAASIILLKEDLAVIYNGVLEGRRAVVNTQKYILMGTSSNFGNMLSMAGAVLILPFLPMLPIQILLNNLLYDFSQTALPLDNVNKEVLKKPINWNVRKIKHFMWVMGPVSSVFDYLTFYVLLIMCAGNQLLFHTGWFVESLVSQVLIIFAIRTRTSMFKSRPNRWVAIMAISVAGIAMILPYTIIGTWFGMEPLPGIFYGYITAVMVAYFAAVEFIKLRFGKYLYPI